MIYDCFLFFNELDLLEIRLNELDGIVDFFVIIEGERTFQNKIKPLYYKNNKERFKKFENKIIHLVIDEKNLSDNNPWLNERTSFNYCLKIDNINDEDFLILSALDEIPNKESIKVAIAKTPCHINMFPCFFYLNTSFIHAYKEYWEGSIIYKFKQIRDSIIEPRDLFEKKTLNPISGGWHFSFLGNAENAVKKVNSYSHSEYNDLDKNFYQDKLNNLLDPFGRGDFNKFSRILDVLELPEYVQKNLEKFEKYLK